MSWTSPSGLPAEMSCRKALGELHRQGRVRLPPASHSYAFHRIGRAVPAETVPRLKCTLAELGTVSVELVGRPGSAAAQTWNALMDAEHYLGRGPLCGAQLRYLVRSERHGVIGALAFSSATKRVRARDEWIGWSPRATRANLSQVVCNSRFLIPTSVGVPHLASHTLALAAARLAEDWAARYGVRPVLLETFVDPTRFQATCYRAANWLPLGQTAGRTAPFANGRTSSGPKDIYVLPLTRRWRHVLCAEPPHQGVSQARLAADAPWTEVEFGAVDLGDARLRRRLFALAEDFLARPGTLIPEVCGGSMAKTKAAYRFLSNPAVDAETVLAPHIDATAARVREHALVLAVQDTTTLNYATHRLTEGLGPINTIGDRSIGLLVHDTLIFTEQGTPLGVIDAQCWARDAAKPGKRHRRYELEIEDKESLKWLRGFEAAAEMQRACPDTTVVVVSDRESDVYELFAKAMEQPDGPRLLVRAERSRKRTTGSENVWEHIGALSPAGSLDVHVPRQHARPARTASLVIRFATITLNAPKRKRGLGPLSMTAIAAQEENASPEVTRPLEWLLLTTADVTTMEDAVRVVSWYARRWGIEVYHRIMKSGCRIEDRRLNTAARLEACLAIDFVVAWRIFQLTTLGREMPHLPATTLLAEDEWRALVWYVTKTPPPPQPPSQRDAVRMIASLGGFLARRGDGEPGVTTTWRGLEYLMVITQAYRVFTANSRASPSRGATCG